MDTLVEICENPHNFIPRPLTFFCGCAMIRGPRSQGSEAQKDTKEGIFSRAEKQCIVENKTHKYI
jgi:hypothetical protein